MTMTGFVILLALSLATVVACVVMVAISKTRLGDWLDRYHALRRLRRKGREERPCLLTHLTDEQWKTHMEAFADYECSTGKYRGFLGCIPQWLEHEALPPSPILSKEHDEGDPVVLLRDSSGKTTGSLYMNVADGEVEICNDLGYVQSVTFANKYQP